MCSGRTIWPCPKPGSCLSSFKPRCCRVGVRQPPAPGCSAPWRRSPAKPPAPERAFAGQQQKCAEPQRSSVLLHVSPGRCKLPSLPLSSQRSWLVDDAPSWPILPDNPPGSTAAAPLGAATPQQRPREGQDSLRSQPGFSGGHDGDGLGSGRREMAGVESRRGWRS